jgi:hypothetical protein
MLEGRHNLIFEYRLGIELNQVTAYIWLKINNNLSYLCKIFHN